MSPEAIAGWQLLFDGVTAVATAIGGTAIVIAFLQWRDQAKRNAEEREWNRMTAAFAHLPKAVDLTPIESRLNESLVRLIDRTGPLTTDELTRILSPDQAQTRIELKNFLNMLEAFCVAINMNLVDDAVARRIYGNKLRRHYDELSPFIDRFRQDQGADVWSELQAVVDRWRTPAS